ncbi:MAG TPA: hypothetical protein VF534_32385 [Paraburkholderia sp.]
MAADNTQATKMRRIGGDEGETALCVAEQPLAAKQACRSGFIEPVR